MITAETLKSNVAMNGISLILTGARRKFSTRMYAIQAVTIAEIMNLGVLKNAGTVATPSCKALIRACPERFRMSTQPGFCTP